MVIEAQNWINFHPFGLHPLVLYFHMLQKTTTNTKWTSICTLSLLLMKTQASACILCIRTSLLKTQHTTNLCVCILFSLIVYHVRCWYVFLFDIATLTFRKREHIIIMKIGDMNLSLSVSELKSTTYFDYEHSYTDFNECDGVLGITRSRTQLKLQTACFPSACIARDRVIFRGIIFYKTELCSMIILSIIVKRERKHFIFTALCDGGRWRISSAVYSVSTQLALHYANLMLLVCFVSESRF